MELKNQSLVRHGYIECVGTELSIFFFLYFVNLILDPAAPERYRSFPITHTAYPSKLPSPPPKLIRRLIHYPNLKYERNPHSSIPLGLVIIWTTDGPVRGAVSLCALEICNGQPVFGRRLCINKRGGTAGGRSKEGGLFGTRERGNPCGDNDDPVTMMMVCAGKGRRRGKYGQWWPGGIVGCGGDGQDPIELKYWHRCWRFYDRFSVPYASIGRWLWQWSVSNGWLWSLMSADEFNSLFWGIVLHYRLWFLFLWKIYA